MKLKNARIKELAEKIKRENARVIIYGAGVIGRTVMPYWIGTYGLQEYVQCFVDQDPKKIGQTIEAGERQYKVVSPEVLHSKIEKVLLLITNSRFDSVLAFLDAIPALDEVEGYIVPVMQIGELNDAEPVAVERLSDRPMIPKVIHYCWFSGEPLPDLLLRCIRSWREFCPDYEIRLWDKHTYDLGKIPFAKEAAERKKYGFAADAARLDILYEYGGIYMDTDVELRKNLDELLYQPAFTGVEKWGVINMGGMAGAVPGHPMIKEILEEKMRCHFVEKDGSLNLETSGIVETLPFIRHGMKMDNSLQRINGVTVYPSSVFAPYDYMSGEERIKSWTVSKHFFYGGWMEEDEAANRGLTQKKFQEILQRMDGKTIQEA